MFTGKGGVGKTTTSVATALYLADRNRVLLLSTDPSGSLSSLFNITFRGTVETVSANLDVIELTRPVILKLWRDKFGEEIYTVISSLLPVEPDIIDYIAGAPALDEEFMLDYLLDVSRSGKYDCIVWDTAPTSSTLNLLQIQHLFYSHLGEAQKLYLNIRGALAKLRRKAGEEPLVLIEKWRKLTEDIFSMLARDTATWIVANPERLPVEQALVIGQSLAAFGIRIDGYILNRIYPEALCTASEFMREKRRSQLVWHDTLIDRADRPVKVIEERAGDITDREALLKIARQIHGT